MYINWKYFDLIQNYDSIYNLLKDYWIDFHVLDFAFWYYWINENTLNAIIDYDSSMDFEQFIDEYGIDLEDYWINFE